MLGGVSRIFQEPPETLFFSGGGGGGGGGGGAAAPKPNLGTTWAKNMYYLRTVFPKTFCTQSRETLNIIM